MSRRKRLTFWGADEDDDSLPRAKKSGAVRHSPAQRNSGSAIFAVCRTWIYMIASSL